MDNTLIKNWNERVGKDDFVIFLGDFAYRNRLNAKNYINRLNGHITFIQGNHDGTFPTTLDSPIQSLVVNIMGTDAYCVHDPKDFSSSYVFNLVGHVHNAWKIKKIYNTYLINVGVDVWRFSPINAEDIAKAIDDFEREWRKKWKRRYG